MKKAIFSLLLSGALASSSLPADACTRILYETGTKSYMVGRTMDWMVDPGTDLWAFPKGMARDGGAGQGSIKWTAKRGSVASSFYNLATVDGMNDAGLVANVLYLVEADYGDAAKSKKPRLSIGAWGQYVLDNFSSVAEAVAALQKEPFILVAPDLPDPAGSVPGGCRPGHDGTQCECRECGHVVTRPRRTWAARPRTYPAAVTASPAITVAARAAPVRLRAATPRRTARGNTEVV